MAFTGEVFGDQDISRDELPRGTVADFDLHRAGHDDNILPPRRSMKIGERRGRPLVDANGSLSDFGG
jgi:hypothetical protein